MRRHIALAVAALFLFSTPIVGGGSVFASTVSMSPSSHVSLVPLKCPRSKKPACIRFQRPV